VFSYESKATNAINSLFSEINNEMHRLGERIYATQVTNHKQQVIRKHNEDISEMQRNYLQLQKEADKDAAFEMLLAQIKERTIERDQMRHDCRQMDVDYKDLVEELQELRDNHNKHAEERKFLEEQIIMAIEAKLKLERRRDELNDELQRLDEEEDESRDELPGASKAD
jgi:hypothetical protein